MFVKRTAFDFKDFGRHDYKLTVDASGDRLESRVVGKSTARFQYAILDDVYHTPTKSPPHVDRTSHSLFAC